MNSSTGCKRWMMRPKAKRSCSLEKPLPSSFANTCWCVAGGGADGRLDFRLPVIRGPRAGGRRGGQGLYAERQSGPRAIYRHHPADVVRHRSVRVLADGGADLPRLDPHSIPDRKLFGAPTVRLHPQHFALPWSFRGFLLGLAVGSARGLYRRSPHDRSVDVLRNLPFDALACAAVVRASSAPQPILTTRPPPEGRFRPLPAAFQGLWGYSVQLAWNKLDAVRPVVCKGSCDLY